LLLGIVLRWLLLGIVLRWLLLGIVVHGWQFLTSKSLASSATVDSFIYRRVAAWYRHTRLSVLYIEELLLGIAVHG